MISKIMQKINALDNILVIKDDQKSIIMAQKSQLQKHLGELLLFKIMTFSEFEQMFLDAFDENIYLCALKNNEQLPVVKDYVKYALSPNYYKVDILDVFRNKYIAYFDKNPINLVQIKTNTFHFLCEPEELKFLILKYNLKAVVHQINSDHTPSVFSFETVKQEILFLFESIAKKLQSGVKIDDIFIVGLSDVNFQLISYYANEYKIPINLDSTEKLSDLPYTKKLLSQPFDQMLDEIQKDVDDDIKLQVNQAIIACLNKYDYQNYETQMLEILKDSLAKIVTTTAFFKEAINFISLDQAYVLADKHIYVINATYGSFPKIENDDGFVSDAQKQAIGTLASYDINTYNQNRYQFILNNAAQIEYVSYAKRDDYQEYSPSDCLKDFHIQPKEVSVDDLVYDFAPNIYKQHFAQKEPTSNLLTTFNARFKFENKKYLRKLVASKIKSLSPSAIISYIRNPFIFYLNRIAKVSLFEENVAIIQGAFFHAWAQIVLRVVFADIVEPLPSLDPNDERFELDGLIKDYINEFDKDNLNLIYDQFVDDFFKLKTYEKLDTNLKIQSRFFVRRNKLNYLDTINYLIAITNSLNLDKLLIENKIENEKFGGYVDYLGIKGNEYIIIDYKFSERPALYRESILDLADKLVKNAPIALKTLDLIQPITYGLLLKNNTLDSSIKLGAVGFLAFYSDGEPKANVMYADDFDVAKIANYSRNADKRMASEADFLALMSIVGQILDKCDSDIFNGRFDNVNILVPNKEDDLTFGQDSDYHAYTFLSYYDLDDENDENSEVNTDE